MVEMKVRHLKVFGTGFLDEVTLPTGIWKCPRTGIFAIFHHYFAHWHGLNMHLRHKALTLFDPEDLRAIAHFPDLKYPINDLDFHPTKPEILLATGQYDGGAMFDGELLIWNYRTNTFRQPIEESREYLDARFKGDEIEFVVTPEHDMEEDFVVRRYVVGERGVPPKLEQLTPIAEYDVADRSRQEAHAKDVTRRLEEMRAIARQNGMPSGFQSMAWSMAFTSDDKLMVGMAQGIIAAINLRTQSWIPIQLANSGAFTQLYFLREQQKLVALLCESNQKMENQVRVFCIDPDSFHYAPGPKGDFVLSRMANGDFLARNTHFREKDPAFTIYSPDFKHRRELTIHAKVLDHHLHLEDTGFIYKVRGYDPNPYDNKRLVEIQPKNGVGTTIFPIEQHPLVYTSPKAIKMGDIFVFHAHAFSPGSKAPPYHCFAMHYNGSRLWQLDFHANATAMCPLEGFPDHFALAMADGYMGIFNVRNGEQCCFLNNYRQVRTGFPMSIASRGNKLAIGYDNGMVEVLEIQT